MMTTLLAAGDPLDHVLPHHLFWLGPINVTNQMFMALVAALLLIILLPMLFNRPTGEAPKGLANFFESILEFLRVEVFRPALKEHTDRFVPFLWTIFFFILLCNLLGQIPLNEIIAVFTGGHVEAEVGATATGNIAVTFALAISTFIFIHVNGIVQVARSLIDGTYGHHGHHEEHSSEHAAHDIEHGRGDALAADVPGDFKAVGNPTKHYAADEHANHHHNKPDHGDLHGGHGHSKGTSPAVAALMAIPLYLWNFAPHPFKPGPGQSPVMWIPDVLIWGLLLVLELIGALIKPFALMIRLFANMIAGHIVLAVLVGLIPVTASLIAQIGIGAPVTVLSLLIRVLELFVAFLQAYIFTFLATLFIASAVAPEH
jgi:F0F1-type ATP synthase membrane subunit a